MCTPPNTFKIWNASRPRGDPRAGPEGEVAKMWNIRKRGFGHVHTVQYIRQSGMPVAVRGTLGLAQKGCPHHHHSFRARVAPSASFQRGVLKIVMWFAFVFLRGLAVCEIVAVNSGALCGRLLVICVVLFRTCDSLL